LTDRHPIIVTADGSIQPNQNVLITPITAVQRGAANVLANWQTVVLRLLESLASGGIVLAVVMTIVTPYMLGNPSPSSLGELVSEHLWIAFGVVVLVLTLIVVFILLHAFISAGNTRTYIDGELAASAETDPLAPAAGFGAFEMQRWVQAARSCMWQVAGIYVSVTVILFLLIFVSMLLVAAIGAIAGPVVCCGLVIVFPMMLVTMAFSAIWSAKAVILCVHRSKSAREALDEAWHLTISKFGTHFWTACIIGLAAVVAGLVIAGVSGVLNLAVMPSKSAPFAMALGPLQIVLFVVQQAFGAAVSSWFAASMTALAEIRRTP
jgi:hypothetical protein